MTFVYLYHPSLSCYNFHTFHSLLYSSSRLTPDASSVCSSIWTNSRIRCGVTYPSNWAKLLLHLQSLYVPIRICEVYL